MAKWYAWDIYNPPMVFSTYGDAKSYITTSYETCEFKVEREEEGVYRLRLFQDYSGYKSEFLFFMIVREDKLSSQEAVVYKNCSDLERHDSNYHKNYKLYSVIYKYDVNDKMSYASNVLAKNEEHAKQVLKEMEGKTNVVVTKVRKARG